MYSFTTSWQCIHWHHRSQWKVHFSRRIVKTCFALWLGKEVSQRESDPKQRGTAFFFQHYPDDYSRYQHKIDVLGCWHKRTGKGALTLPVRLLLDHSSNSLDRLSDKMLSLAMGYNGWRKWISGANRWFKPTFLHLSCLPCPQISSLLLSLVPS